MYMYIYIYPVIPVCLFEINEGSTLIYGGHIKPN